MLAFYTLVAAQVSHPEATGSVRRGMSKRFPIPVVLLARLAVDRSQQGAGLGGALLADAMRRSIRAADEVGVRAVMVDALNANAAAFYKRFGFPAVNSDSLLLMATIAEFRTAAG